MATSVPKVKLSIHARSISLPSSSHPLIPRVEQQLDRLRSSEGASSSSHTSLCQKLDGLKNLFECLDDVLQLPLSQQALVHKGNGKWEEEVLDGSLRLLDICSTVRDIYSQMKETVQEFESSLRRKRCRGLNNEIDAYVASRKKLNKIICKCNKELKRAEKNSTIAVATKDLELVNLIREVQEVTFTMFESSLSFISGTKADSRPRGWSLVSRVLQPQRISCNGESDIDGIEKIEGDLLLLKSKKSNQEMDLLQMQNLLKGLQALNLGIQELEELLEVAFRLLLKTRVSLLNILNQ